MLIHPEIIVTPDYPIIRIKEPREKFDLAVELPKILHTQGWDVGTYFHFQFVSHDRTQLLSEALFVVTEAKEHTVVNEANPYMPNTRTLGLRKAEMVGEWFLTKFGAEDILAKGDAVAHPAAIEEPAKRDDLVKGQPTPIPELKKTRKRKTA